jgi:Ca2+-binding EF-hand superfamily protein
LSRRHFSLHDPDGNGRIDAADLVGLYRMI